MKAATPAESENVDTAALEKVIATAKGLNKNDYTATTWTTMQAALTNAEKALEAKESQTSVDEAAKTLQAAIDGLKKASATTTTTDDKKNNNNSSNKNNNNSNTNNNKNNTTNSSTNKNSTTSPKTGDPDQRDGITWRSYFLCWPWWSWIETQKEIQKTEIMMRCNQ